MWGFCGGGRTLVAARGWTDLLVWEGWVRGHAGDGLVDDVYDAVGRWHVRLDHREEPARVVHHDELLTSGEPKIQKSQSVEGRGLVVVGVEASPCSLCS